MPINAGKLRHRINIQKRTTATNDFLDGEQTWMHVPNGFRRAAYVRPLVAREIDRARQVESETTHEIIIRSLPGIDTTHRLIFKGRVFQIEGVIDVDEAGVEMMLRCIESSETDEDGDM